MGIPVYWSLPSPPPSNTQLKPSLKATRPTSSSIRRHPPRRTQRALYSDIVRRSRDGPLDLPELPSEDGSRLTRFHSRDDLRNFQSTEERINRAVSASRRAREIQEQRRTQETSDAETLRPGLLERLDQIQQRESLRRRARLGTPPFALRRNQDEARDMLDYLEFAQTPPQEADDVSSPETGSSMLPLTRTPPEPIPQPSISSSSSEDENAHIRTMIHGYMSGER